MIQEAAVDVNDNLLPAVKFFCHLLSDISPVTMTETYPPFIFILRWKGLGFFLQSWLEKRSKTKPTSPHRACIGCKVSFTRILISNTCFPFETLYVIITLLGTFKTFFNNIMCASYEKCRFQAGKSEKSETFNVQKQVFPVQVCPNTLGSLIAIKSRHDRSYRLYIYMHKNAHYCSRKRSNESMGLEGGPMQTAIKM